MTRQYQVSVARVEGKRSRTEGAAKPTRGGQGDWRERGWRGGRTWELKTGILLRLDKIQQDVCKARLALGLWVDTKMSASVDGLREGGSDRRVSACRRAAGRRGEIG